MALAAVRSWSLRPRRDFPAPTAAPTESGTRPVEDAQAEDAVDVAADVAAAAAVEVVAALAQAAAAGTESSVSDHE